MKKLTVKSIDNLKLDTSIAEQVKGKGSGTLFFKNRNSVIEAYYRYYHNKIRVMLKIGMYKVGNNSSYALVEIRAKALEYSQLKLQHPNLKEYLDNQQLQKELEKQIKANTGSFEDMLNSYTDSLSPSSVR